MRSGFESSGPVPAALTKRRADPVGNEDFSLQDYLRAGPPGLGDENTIIGMIAGDRYTPLNNLTSPKAYAVIAKSDFVISFCLVFQPARPNLTISCNYKV